MLHHHNQPLSHLSAHSTDPRGPRPPDENLPLNSNHLNLNIINHNNSYHKTLGICSGQLAQGKSMVGSKMPMPGSWQWVPCPGAIGWQRKSHSWPRKGLGLKEQLLLQRILPAFKGSIFAWGRRTSLPHLGGLHY